MPIRTYRLWRSHSLDSMSAVINSNPQLTFCKKLRKIFFIHTKSTIFAESNEKSVKFKRI